MATLTLKKKKAVKTSRETDPVRAFVKSFRVLTHGRLLKIGIDKDLKIEYDKIVDPVFSFKQVRYFLYKRVNKGWYKKLIEKKGERTGLRGEKYPFEKQITPCK